QANAPWNLARISHRARGSTEYVYNRVSNVYIYILDSGIRTSHQTFQGRAINAYNAGTSPTPSDTLGSGTHLACIAAGETYGVARGATVIGVKVFDNSGGTTVSQVISAINWAVQDMTTKGRTQRSTALLALGGAASTALNNAVASASTAGLFFAVPAGDSNTIVNTSPANEPSACTVAGSTINDARMTTSNYGSAVDIFAPGQNIIAAAIGSDTATVLRSGTPYAAAHIAGLGAYFLAMEGPRTPAALCLRLKAVATQGVLTGVPAGTVNLLAYNLSGL
ncbi:Apo cuticle-degrading protease from verticillium Psalliotae, partial [Sporormia fimetaria CBS 119925]